MNDKILYIYIRNSFWLFVRILKRYKEIYRVYDIDLPLDSILSSDRVNW